MTNNNIKQIEYIGTKISTMYDKNTNKCLKMHIEYSNCSNIALKNNITKNHIIDVVLYYLTLGCAMASSQNKSSHFYYYI